MHVWTKRNQLRRIFSCGSGIALTRANVDPKVPALCPAEFVFLLKERGDAGFALRILTS